MSTKKTKFYSIAFAIHISLLACSGQEKAQNQTVTIHTPARNTVSEEQLFAQISFLSDSLCQGRATGTMGNAEAASWIRGHFIRAGLLKLGDTYAHGFVTGNGLAGHNIIAMLPGSERFRHDRYVIVGAHFDHIGILNGLLYPGADANASGTVALVNLANMLATTRSIGKSHNSNIIFVAFDGKECNMAGSAALWEMIENGELEDPLTGKAITKDKIGLMVNIDQIGSTLSPLNPDRKDYMIMLGAHSLNPGNRELLETCNRMFSTGLDLGFTYYGSGQFTKLFYRLSDQRVFVDNRIPSVVFTSGITMNNNKPRDLPQTLNMEVLRRRIYLIYHWIEKML